MSSIFRIALLCFGVFALSWKGHAQVSETIERPYPRQNGILIDKLEITRTGDGAFSVDATIFSNHFFFTGMAVGGSIERDGRRVFVNEQEPVYYISPSDTRAFAESLFPPTESVAEWFLTFEDMFEEANTSNPDFRYIRSGQDVETKINGIDMSCDHNALVFDVDARQVWMMQALDLFTSSVKIVNGASDLFGGKNRLVADNGWFGAIGTQLDEKTFLRLVVSEMLQNEKLIRAAWPYIESNDINGLLSDYFVTEEFIQEVFLEAIVEVITKVEIQGGPAKDRAIAARVAGALFTVNQGTDDATFVASSVDEIINQATSELSKRYKFVGALLLARDAAATSIDIFSQGLVAKDSYEPFFVRVLFEGCEDSGIQIYDAFPKRLLPDTENNVIITGEQFDQVSQISSVECPLDDGFAIQSGSLISFRCRPGEIDSFATFRVSALGGKERLVNIPISNQSAQVDQISVRPLVEPNTIFEVVIEGNWLVDSVIDVEGCSNLYTRSKVRTRVWLECNGIAVTGTKKITVTDQLGEVVGVQLFSVGASIEPRVSSHDLLRFPNSTSIEFRIYGANFIINGIPAISVDLYGCDPIPDGQSVEVTSSAFFSFRCDPSIGEEVITAEIYTDESFGGTLIYVLAEAAGLDGLQLQAAPKTLPVGRQGIEYAANVKIIGGSKPYTILGLYSNTSTDVICNSAGENCSAVSDFEPDVEFDGFDSVNLAGEICEGHVSGRLDLFIRDSDGEEVLESWEFPIASSSQQHFCTTTNDGGRYEVAEPFVAEFVSTRFAELNGALFSAKIEREESNSAAKVTVRRHSPDTINSVVDVFEINGARNVDLTSDGENLYLTIQSHSSSLVADVYSSRDGVAWDRAFRSILRRDMCAFQDEKFCYPRKVRNIAGLMTVWWRASGGYDVLDIPPLNRQIQIKTRGSDYIYAAHYDGSNIVALESGLGDGPILVSYDLGTGNSTILDTDFSDGSFRMIAVKSAPEGIEHVFYGDDDEFYVGRSGSLELSPWDCSGDTGSTFRHYSPFRWSVSDSSGAGPYSYSVITQRTPTFLELSSVDQTCPVEIVGSMERYSGISEGDEHIVVAGESVYLYDQIAGEKPFINQYQNGELVAVHIVE